VSGKGALSQWDGTHGEVGIERIAGQNGDRSSNLLHSVEPWRRLRVIGLQVLSGESGLSSEEKEVHLNDSTQGR
jgi:hypothetical protein